MKITNTGPVAGSEVLQLYISAPNSETQRPVKELHGFEKVFLQPGESKTVSIGIDPYAMSFWDESEAKWCVEKGVYSVWVGTTGSEGTSKGKGVKGAVEVAKTRWWLGL